jgi:hypothetical protein
LFCVLTGFGLIVLGWGRTAHLAVVALQLPYLLSAGLTGLGLVVTGVTLVSWDARLADSRIRSSQLDEMRALMSELNRRLDSR